MLILNLTKVERVHGRRTAERRAWRRAVFHKYARAAWRQHGHVCRPHSPDSGFTMFHDHVNFAKACTYTVRNFLLIFN
ncbi:hypothetical protein PUN28_004742 [Cardiocondyla obscurior]|uniref:Uncharacterized protein n=1 Tax=Cardiocondyla obscurior TaxID=286306 RepID=A0AAW2GFF0_9HYME